MLDFDDLKKLGIVLKRARFFITCKGKHMGSLDADIKFIKANLSYDSRSVPLSSGYIQLSLFDTNKNMLTGETEHGIVRSAGSISL